MQMYPRLAELREDRDLSQAEMAKVLRVSQSTYSRYENGKLDIPSQALIAGAGYNKVSVASLLGGEDGGKRGRAPAAHPPGLSRFFCVQLRGKVSPRKVTEAMSARSMGVSKLHRPQLKSVGSTPRFI